MKIEKSKIIILCIALIIIMLTIPNMNKQAESMRNMEAVDVSDGSVPPTVLARFLGIKQAATDILWVKQTLAIGGITQGEIASAEEIYQNSREMSYLNPYFVGNYYFSGTILGMVEIYRQYTMAGDIFETGIEYLPTDPYIRNYYAGVIAYSKGDDAGALSNFETVALKYKDPTLINTIAFIYENKYTQTHSLSDLNQAIYYWKENAVSTNSYYSDRAIEKLKQFTNY
ncbi:MAG: hypothetical protein NTX05_03555 [Fusobacteria bacterium]|nr:hypothetical protein [Fusobacteriota bacterium]